MSCPECEENRQRAQRAAEAESLLLLFTETFSKLARKLWELEGERDRRRYADNPPPPGASPARKRRFLLLRADLLGGEVDKGQDVESAAH